MRVSLRIPPAQANMHASDVNTRMRAIHRAHGKRYRVVHSVVARIAHGHSEPLLFIYPSASFVCVVSTSVFGMHLKGTTSTLPRQSNTRIGGVSQIDASSADPDGSLTGVVRTHRVLLAVDGVQQYPEGCSIESRVVFLVDYPKSEREVRSSLLLAWTRCAA